MEISDVTSLIECRSKYYFFNDSYFETLKVKPCHIEQMGVKLQGSEVRKIKRTENDEKLILSKLFFALNFFDKDFIKDLGLTFDIKKRKQLFYRYKNAKANYHKDKANSVELGTIRFTSYGVSDFSLSSYSLVDLLNGNGLEAILHEIGHAIDDHMSDNFPFWSEHSSKWKEISEKEPHVSEYSFKDVSESFAEASVAYMFNPFLKCFAPERYKVMSQNIILNNAYDLFQNVDCNNDRVKLNVRRYIENFSSHSHRELPSQ